MPSRSSRCVPVILGAAVAVVLLGSSAALAQAYQNPNLPRSPYALPVPQYHEGQDVDDEAPPQGSWRHWGDTRNEGQVFQQLFAPGGVAGGTGYVPDPARARFCRQHPDTCGN